MLNKIIVMGRLTHDPELRRTGSGTPVCSFSIACDRDFKSQSGEKETDFFDVVAWRTTGEFVSKYFTKGRMVVVEGRLQIREWQDISTMPTFIPTIAWKRFSPLLMTRMNAEPVSTWCWAIWIISIRRSRRVSAAAGLSWALTPVRW